MAASQNRITLIVGGSRSGKSRQALEMAEPDQRKAFVATGVATDEEMKQRIVNHQLQRGPAWTTFEAPYELVAILEAQMQHFDTIVVDCLTFWVSNLLLRDGNDDEMSADLQKLVDLLHRRKANMIIVSNEVGMGVVPDSALGRQFRDIAGFANQRLAEISDQIFLMVAGIPLQVK